MKEGPDTAQRPTPHQGSSGETTARQNLEDEVDFLFQELQKRRKEVLWSRLEPSTPPHMESILALLLVSTVSGSGQGILFPWASVSTSVKWSSLMVLFISNELA